MEDIEYLEEYEDFILPKTLSYSEEYPENNANQKSQIEEPNNQLYSISALDAPGCANEVQHCPIEQPPRIKKNNFIKILNTEVLSTTAQIQNFRIEPSTTLFMPVSPALQTPTQPQIRYEPPKTSFLDRLTQNPSQQRVEKYKSVATVKPTIQKPFALRKPVVLSSSILSPHASSELLQNISSFQLKPSLEVSKEDDSFLDFALTKNDVNDFNSDFNLDTAEISDICSESMNFSDEYNEDIFNLDSLLSSDGSAKKKRKRKKNHDLSADIDIKKAKTEFESSFVKHIQKSEKPNVTKIFANQLSTSKNSDKKKNRLSAEKKKCNLSATKSKVVVKKNGKKFLFPDRSKFSLKHLNNMNNTDEDSQQASNVNNSQSQNPTPKADEHTMASGIPSTSVDSVKVQEKDIVIFSSPTAMKRLSKPMETEPSDSHETKSTPVAFSLKSIKPPSGIQIKKTPTPVDLMPQISDCKELKTTEHNDANQTAIDPENPNGAEVEESESNQPLQESAEPITMEKESHEGTEESQPPMEKLTDSSIVENENTLEEPISEVTKNPDPDENRIANHTETEVENANIMTLESQTEPLNSGKEDDPRDFDKNLEEASEKPDSNLENDLHQNNVFQKEINSTEKTLKGHLDESNLSQTEINSTEKSLEDPQNSAEETISAKTQNESQPQVGNKIKVVEIDMLKEKSPINEPNSLKDESLNERESQLDCEKSKDHRPLREETVQNMVSQLADSNDNLINDIDQFTEELSDNNNKQKSSPVANSNSTPAQEKTPEIAKPQPPSIAFEPKPFSIQLGKNIVAKLMEARKTRRIAKKQAESKLAKVFQKSSTSKTSLQLESQKLKTPQKGAIAKNSIQLESKTLKSPQKLTTPKTQIQSEIKRSRSPQKCVTPKTQIQSETAIQSKTPIQSDHVIQSDNTVKKSKGKKGRNKNLNKTLDSVQVNEKSIVSDSTDNLTSNLSSSIGPDVAKRRRVQKNKIGLTKPETTISSNTETKLGTETTLASAAHVNEKSSSLVSDSTNNLTQNLSSPIGSDVAKKTRVQKNKIGLTKPENKNTNELKMGTETTLASAAHVNEKSSSLVSDSIDSLTQNLSSPIGSDVAKKTRVQKNKIVLTKPSETTINSNMENKVSPSSNINELMMEPEATVFNIKPPTISQKATEPSNEAQNIQGRGRKKLTKRSAQKLINLKGGKKTFLLNETLSTPSDTQSESITTESLPIATQSPCIATSTATLSPSIATRSSRITTHIPAIATQQTSIATLSTSSTLTAALCTHTATIPTPTSSLSSHTATIPTPTSTLSTHTATIPTPTSTLFTPSVTQLTTTLSTPTAALSTTTVESSRDTQISSTKVSAATPVATPVISVSGRSTFTESNSKQTSNDIEIIIEPKKELDDLEQFRTSTNFIITNDSLVNKIKTNVSPGPCLDQTIGASSLNSCKSTAGSFENDQNHSKITIFELPAFIVMKTKIIARKDIETTKPIDPSKIKQQVEPESDAIISESAIKTERMEFNNVCAQINALLEQNANYLKFASGSERLSRMKDVLNDFSLTAEDATCTLKFMQSYLCSDPRDKAIRTRGQQFIPIYDSQKKIIGYRKRTIHVKPSSRSSQRRSSRLNPTVLSTSNEQHKQNVIETNVNPPIPPKIEPELMNTDSELILPDTSPVNGVDIKTEESLLG